jgi:hypothetical protein
MAKKAEDIYREALLLPDEEWEKLWGFLVSPPEGDFASPEIEQAWLEEARRRDRAVAEGKDKLIPVEEMMRELRKHYC